MTRKPYEGLGGRYNCPICGERAAGGPHRRLGNFSVHLKCKAVCPLCKEEILEPPIGQRYTIDAHLGSPAHKACKDAHETSFRVMYRLPDKKRNEK